MILFFDLDIVFLTNLHDCPSRFKIEYRVTQEAHLGVVI